jgi:hypothetical protein
MVGWLTRLPGSLAYPTRYVVFARTFSHYAVCIGLPG